MNIVACVKRVPLTDVAVKPAADGVSLDTAGFEYSLSFYDDLAVEAAIQTKEKHGGEVTVMTLGPSEASKELRECLAKGADKGVILKDGAWGARDPRSTAKALAAKVGELGAQVVFCGRVATDRDNAAVGPMLATYLGWACVTDVTELPRIMREAFHIATTGRPGPVLIDLGSSNGTMRDGEGRDIDFKGLSLI